MITYVSECRMGLDEHIVGGQGTRVGVSLLILGLLRFDYHLRNLAVAHHSRHRGVQLVSHVSLLCIYCASITVLIIPGPWSGDVHRF